MPTRTQHYLKVPWTGGINTSVDQGVVPDNDLIVADNVVFSSTSARLKRQGYARFDLESDLPAIVSRSSSGTTRTIVFASPLNTTGPDVDALVVGEQIAISSSSPSESNYVGTYGVTSITGATITYTALGSLTESTTAITTSFSITRRPYIDVKDFWYSDTSGVKQRFVVGTTDQGKIFKFDSNGRRTEIKPRAVTFTTVDTAAETATITSHGFLTGNRGYLTTSGTLPGGLSAGTAYYLIVVDANTVKFATSLANALAGTPVVNISSSGTGTQTFRIRSLSQPMLGLVTLDRAQSAVFNNKLVIVTSGVGNYPIIFDPQADSTKYTDLAPQAPDCDMISEHIGRLWTNDKLDKDLLHYCSTFDHTEWLGIGDSGAIPTTPGDGDPEGITSIFPSFKQTLFITKKVKTYRISGYSPEEFQIVPVSNGLGSEGPRSATAVDLDDVMYISQRGVHSLAATNNYGDFDASYLSTKIKPTFDSWNRPDLKKVSGVYVPDLNSVAFNIVERGQDFASALWLYNVEQKEWYRWPDTPAICLAGYLDADARTRMLWSTIDGKLNVTQAGEYVDFGSDSIRYRVRTGQIYPDSNPQSWKHFKKITMLYKPRGRYSFTLRVWIDNTPVQSFSFSQSIQGDVLGTNFILGQSVLGSSAVFAPYTVDIEGHGRSIQFEIENDNKDEQVELYGYSIEFENADYSPETNESI